MKEIAATGNWEKYNMSMIPLTVNGQDYFKRLSTFLIGMKNPRLIVDFLFEKNELRCLWYWRYSILLCVLEDGFTWQLLSSYEYKR